MVVTINTDASTHTKELVGAYAFWIVCDQGKIKRFGAFRAKVKNPTDAEIKSICNGLSSLLESKFTDVFHVVVNTDCTNAIDGIQGTGPYAHLSKNSKAAMHARELIKKLKRKYPKLRLIDFRHVKAHSGVGDKRSIVNEWCDAQAKAAMWNKFNTTKQNELDKKSKL